MAAACSRRHAWWCNATSDTNPRALLSAALGAALRAFPLALVFASLWPMLAICNTAHALDRPTGTVLLTIEGAVTAPNQGDKAQFDMSMLEKLPQHTFTTLTPWYPEPVTFTGPLLRDILAAAGAKGQTITAVALNDYKTEIPFDDVHRHDVIVARLMNKRPMPVREKGPLFIVYPFDSKPELRAELYYNRAAWQLKMLRVR